jgi:hypothetical protein
MHPSAAIFDEAISLARLEELALKEEDIDRAEELADKRADLLFDAWRIREGYANDLLVERLQTLQSMQQHLQEQATLLRAKLGAQIVTERKQARYLDGYRHANEQRQKSFYCDKRS